MKSAIVVAVLACVTSSGIAAEGPPPQPPPPAPVVLPSGAAGASVPAVPALPDGDAPAVPKVRKKAKGKPPKIRLGEKRERDTPEGRGAGYIPTSKADVKAVGGKLTAVLTGAAFSHSFFGAHSVSVSALQLVQEFEVVPGAPSDPLVRLSLSGKIDGYVRSEKHGAAGLRLANASVTPACGGPTLGVVFPPCRISDTSRERCRSAAEPTQLDLPPGKYVLVANLVLETDVDGILRSHAEAVFSPGNHYLGDWKSNDSEKPDVERKDFGLIVTLKASAAD